MDVCEGRAEVGKGKGKLIEEDDASSTQDDLDDIDKHLAFLARKFSKLKVKRNATAPRPFRRSGQPKSSNLVNRSKSKCYNCGLAEHFSNECRKHPIEKNRSSTKNVDYRKKYFELLK